MSHDSSKDQPQKNNGNLSSTPDTASGTPGDATPVMPDDRSRMGKPGKLEVGDTTHGMTSLNQARVGNHENADASPGHASGDARRDRVQQLVNEGREAELDAGEYEYAIQNGIIEG